VEPSVGGGQIMSTEVWKSLPAQNREAIRSATSETFLR